MNASPTNLKTLLAWAADAEAGRPSPELVAWLRAAPMAPSCWERLQSALEQLRRGDRPAEEPRLPADLVACYVDGLCDAEEAARVEQTCWTSPADLIEVISGLRFNDSLAEEGGDAGAVRPSAADAAFNERLVALLPTENGRPQSGPTGDARDALRPSRTSGRWRVDDESVVAPTGVLQSEPSMSAWNVRPRPASSEVRRRSRGPSIMAWSLGAAAALVLLVLLGLLWRASDEARSPGSTSDIASDQKPSREERRDVEAPNPEPAPPRSDRSDDATSGDSRADGTNSETSPRRPRAKDLRLPPTPRPRRPGDSVAHQEGPPGGTRPVEPPVSPAPTPQDVVRPAPVAVAIRSELGAALVPGTTPGSWRVGRGEQPLSAPLPIVSLADSWTTADIPGVGTLVLDGESFATVSIDADRTLRVSLDRGRVGMRGLAEKTTVRFESAGQRWETTGVGDYSTFAVVRETESASVFVSTGIIAVNTVNLADGQVTDVEAGAPSPPRSLDARAAPSASSFVPNPFDARWLQAPDERRRKEWQATYGKLVERLGTSDDVAGLLPELRGAARDGRQHALVARWSLSLAPDRAAAVWDMLSDRQKFVRLAAARELLSIPPRDGQLRTYFTEFRQQSDGPTAATLLEWVGRSHRAAPLGPAQAMELVEGLGHPLLPLRQMAALLLEHHAQDALRAARLRAPAYDPEDPPAKRAIAQAQWKAIVAQAFGVRVRGAANAPR